MIGSNAPGALRLLTLHALLFTLLCFSGTAKAEDKTIRIGSWNIEWCGLPQKRTLAKIERKPADVAAYVKASGVSILGLNEICGEGENPNELRSSVLTKAFAILNEQTGQKWKYVLFPRREAEDKVLLTGIAWDESKVKMVGKPLKIPVRLTPKWERIWNRHPYAIKFSLGEGLTDVVVVPVHMKSNGGGFQKTKVQRGEEAKTLIRSLGAIQNELKDDDVMILGDFNTLFGDETCMMRFRWGGFYDLNARSQNTWIKSDRYDYAPFDRILVPNDQEEFSEATFVVNRNHPFDGAEEKYRKFLSDHYMVYSDIKVMKDDD